MRQSSIVDARGFALVIVLALLAFMTLALYSLSVLSKVGASSVNSSEAQMIARENALVGLNRAVGQIQALVGKDGRVTGIAGVAGAEVGSPMRHWCGVWDSSGAFLGWMTSGASSGTTPGLGTSEVVQLVGEFSVGSPSADQEAVYAGKVPLEVLESNGERRRLGAFAYWVGDEGVKISAAASMTSLPPGGIRFGAPSTPTNVNRVITAFQSTDSENGARIINYEQSTALVYSGTAKLTRGHLRGAFHHVTLRHMTPTSAPGGYVTGMININTTSAAVWRSIFETYETAPGATAFGSTTKRTTTINGVANGIAATTSAGKSAFGPFLSTDTFLNSSLLGTQVSGTTGIPLGSFQDVVRPMLTTRSTTFRVRAYGEAVDRLDSSRVEVTATCEAIVQLTNKSKGPLAGNKAVITYFRWLGPDDI